MKISTGEQELVSKATFKKQSNERGCGQCVLIEGGLIITASHCVDWNNEGGMTLGDHFLSKITTDAGILTASISAVEPVSDIAILESPNSQTFYEESNAFDDYFENIKPVKLCLETPNRFKSFPVWVWTHLNKWVAGEATFYGGNSTFGYKTDVEITGGTSGGPIVNENGELVGVVSQGTTTEENGKFTSSAALLVLALPAWVIARVKNYRNMN
jgi:S1-C subfamily serine protease